MTQPTQTPQPGTQLVQHCGDILTISLTLDHDAQGEARLRTNLGRARVRREEIIEHVEKERPALAHDWHDMPMKQTGPRTFSISIPLLEVGYFAAKAFFIDAVDSQQTWPSGDDTMIKVEPAACCSSNSIYTVFPRQFGARPAATPHDEKHQLALVTLENEGYTVIPRSGTFRDVIKELDLIIGTLGFRIIQLLPIHPVPTTYARMGRFGSPFASLDFMDVDPAMAEFDRQTTPLEQFGELVDAVHQRGASVFIDLPVNHTGWASSLQIHHPDWFARNRDATFQSPGAWGVTWEDLSRLDYASRELWMYMADVFLFWCAHGVDGFRCDAGYMVPLPVWEYITARVRTEYPDTIFMLEGLGGKKDVTGALLTSANLDWAYSELFQNYSRQEIEHYLPEAVNESMTRGLLVHFAETHDNTRLAATSKDYARMRTALSSLFSHNGAFGITNGVEWFATEKVDVHGAPGLNWGSDDNQVALLARLNAILSAHPAFQSGATLRMIQRGAGNTLALLRTPADPASPSVLVLVNLDTDHANPVAWDTDTFPAGAALTDLISGSSFTLERDTHPSRAMLTPAQVVCLQDGTDPLSSVLNAEKHFASPSPGQVQQRLRAKALEIAVRLAPEREIRESDGDQLARELAGAPLAFCRALAPTDYAPVTTWTWPADRARSVPLPEDHLLLVSAEHPFSTSVVSKGRTLRHERSLPGDNGTHFTLLAPLHGRDGACSLRMTVHTPDRPVRSKSELVLLPSDHGLQVRRCYARRDVQERGLYALCTNGRGAMSHVRGAWGELLSQYDAMLAANLDERVPVDRHVMLTRCRMWLVHVGYSQEINSECLRDFAQLSPNTVRWRFDVPCGMGKRVPLDIQLHLVEGENTIHLHVHRTESGVDAELLEDDIPVKIIVRPDIEDRSFHTVTKAYAGPESKWIKAITPSADGFSFTPGHGRTLGVVMPDSTFVSEPEWQYMIPHPIDAARGVNGKTDLFSPGYFETTLLGHERRALHAHASAGHSPDPAAHSGSATEGATHTDDTPRPLRDALHEAMDAYVVARDDSRTVIAGYPWFLDWGRDTLICLRGMIRGDMLNEATDILTQFARFEENGTLPNMIRGNDQSNRDTSDAPLWLFVACADFRARTGSDDILARDCNGRTMLDVLESIARNYMSGTPNGIRMDPASGLIFSPPHFTWMDTNHPAGTPRKGYPIEIQALWYAALHLLGDATGRPEWTDRAQQVQTAIVDHFHRSSDGFLADCLHTAGGPASEAIPDDCLRPNQLLAITLGACRDPAINRAVLDACASLLVPGGIRSLADQPVSHPLAIEWKGQHLNDPHKPYWGYYGGDEDTRRKPAYHNGTAWSWMFPSYSEALFLTYGTAARSAALSLLESSTHVIGRDCIGHVPEIMDGNAPHAARGCGAQAWGVTELYRVLSLLSDHVD